MAADTEWAEGSADIAVIGMAGRFPGARSLEEFWRNLRDGVESITFFSDEELLAARADPSEIAQPNYVKAAPVLNDIESFDASFFGYSAQEATILDPQQRIFLECAWEAFEDAGYDPQALPGLIGVYAGASASTYLLSNLLSDRGFTTNDANVLLANDKDYMAGRVAYKLNLTGPAVGVQSGCSTALAAVHFAYQALLSYECDIALAGGITVRVPQHHGYRYEQGSMLSPDGHCRSFDAAARGTVFGSGAGVVVLRRLADALEEGDRIEAVIKGSAINNDGARKVGFTAPSVEGQSQVIATALGLAGVEPHSVTAIEAHGTGTPLGDAIEIAALERVFGNPGKKRFCAIGSVKSNVGHLDHAAGIASLIKAILQLKYRQLVPSLHFRSANPAINFESGSFYVNTELSEWKARDTPRRIGVSSFAGGGTNVHLILEEAPPRAPCRERQTWHILPISAKTPGALDVATANLSAYLSRQPDLAIDDIAYTLQVGRQPFRHRRVLACSRSDDVARVLSLCDPERVWTSDSGAGERPVAFMFPGVDSRYPNMGQGLYEASPAFRRYVDDCAEVLHATLGLSLPESLMHRDAVPSTGRASHRLTDTAAADTALFVIEYALAKLLEEWGVRPRAMIGCGIGEIAAACLAEVLSLEDALSLVVGSTHPASKDFLRKPPRVPYITQETGDWASAGQVKDHTRWVPDSRQAERFGEGISKLLDEVPCLLEVGPGQALSALARRHASGSSGDTILASLPRSHDRDSEIALILATVGRLWLAGVPVNWSRLHAHEHRRRVPLPTYPFERDRYWKEPWSSQDVFPG